MSAKGKKKASAHESYIQSYVAIIVLFCASGTGVFGAMREGMTGDASILIAKAFLDFFTATIFACRRHQHYAKVTSRLPLPHFWQQQPLRLPEL